MKILFTARYRLLVTLFLLPLAAVVTLAAVMGCRVTPMRSLVPLEELQVEQTVRMLISVNHRQGKYGLALWCRQRSTAG
jgi:hypothetical protein